MSPYWSGLIKLFWMLLLAWCNEAHWSALSSNMQTFQPVALFGNMPKTIAPSHGTKLSEFVECLSPPFKPGIVCLTSLCFQSLHGICPFKCSYMALWQLANRLQPLTQKSKLYYFALQKCFFYYLKPWLPILTGNAITTQIERIGVWIPKKLLTVISPLYSHFWQSQHFPMSSWQPWIQTKILEENCDKDRNLRK